MDMRQRIAELVKEMIGAAFPGAQGLPEDFAALLEVPPDPGLGDYAFPCFKLSRALRMGAAASLAASICDCVCAGVNVRLS